MKRFLILSLVVVVAACADNTFRSVWGCSKCYSVVSWIPQVDLVKAVRPVTDILV